MILLDTSYLVSLAKGSPEAEKVIDLVEKEGVALTSISLFEIFRFKMSGVERRYFEQLFSTYPVLPLDADSAERASKIWVGLERVGQPVNVLDVLIAGVMKANGISKIITSDEDFMVIGKVEELEVVLL
jgi:predicted nucleic acid-binding protein